MSLDLRLSEGSVFASRRLTAHLARGLAAALFITGAIVFQQAHPWVSLAAGVTALVALRGCPVCWSIGLIETASIAMRKGGHPNRNAEIVLPPITSRKSTLPGSSPAAPATTISGSR